MKKLLLIAAFGAAVSLAASFGFGRIEVSSRPLYDQQRDQQWMESRRHQREQAQREQWQRVQWQREQSQRRQQHQQWQDYEWWVRHHPRDYDNRNGR